VVILAPQTGPAFISCWIPADAQKHYATPRDPNWALMAAPAIAQAQHVSGCAAVAFQITRDGKATNISVLREFPPGYGYGTAVSDEVRRSTFAPPTSEQDWYYRAASVGFAGKRPAVPGQIVPPQQPVGPLQRT
jgi:hypothetical protein